MQLPGGAAIGLVLRSTWAAISIALVAAIGINALLAWRFNAALDTLVNGELALAKEDEALLRSRVDALQQERTGSLVAGTILLAGAGIIAAGLVARSRRTLEASQRNLRVTAVELARANGALVAANQALREAAAGRDRALAELQATISQREEFLAIVSHDLNNPLQAIKGQSQLLRRLLAHPERADMAQVRERLASIDATASKMGGLIKELLDVVQVRAGQALALDLQPTDLVALAQRVVEEHAQTADQHRFRFEAATTSLVGQWDGARLERVLGNLLSNAVKYSPEGGEIRVTVAQEDGPGESFAVLAVQDQGVGIPAADVPHIFDQFTRAANVDERIAGTGLGLASARHIVESHGGTITVESQEEVGSTFTIRLPLAGAREAAAA